MAESSCTKSMKQRGQNFSSLDNEIFLEIVKPYVSIIETKKNDQSTLEKRRRAWSNILLEFNSTSSSIRSLNQVKDLYKRLKIKAKKEVSQYNKTKRGTGGGPKGKSSCKTSKLFQELIPSHFQPLDNPYDDDATEMADRESVR